MHFLGGVEGTGETLGVRAQVAGMVLSVAVAMDSVGGVRGTCPRKPVASVGTHCVGDDHVMTPTMTSTVLSSWSR
jgi:hypothetical protein